MILAGVFNVDPSFGYPAGAPAGRPDRVSLAGNLHGLGFLVSMISWVVLLAVLAAWLRRAGDRPWAAASLGAAAALLLVPALSGAPFGTAFLYLAVSGAFVFTSALLGHLGRLR
jgi:hypothetical protein